MSHPVPIPCPLTQANTVSFECYSEPTGILQHSVLQQSPAKPSPDMTFSALCSSAQAEQHN
jgi:hypothetical protein